MQIDPVTTEVIRNALCYSAEEVGIALRNSAYSPNIKERMDHSCALFDPHGNLLAQAEHIPVHLGSLPWGAKNVIRYLEENGDEWKIGDLVMVNDPYIAGTHLNDVTVIKPVFFEGILIGFSANKAHHVDVGGEVAGSISSDATSLFQEGTVIPPVKLIDGGHFDEDILENFLSGVRNPDISQGDLRAQIAAASLGERRLLELAEKYGADMIFGVFGEIISYGERRMRQQLQQIPEGAYTAEDCLEDVVGTDTLTWIRVRLERTEGGLEVDFTGTDPQVEAPFNAVFGVTLSATYFAVKSIVDPEGPMNEGILKPIIVHASHGSLVNPKSPAPVSGGNLETSQRIADTVFRALAQALPGHVPAASQGSMNNVNAGGFDPKRNRQWTFCETLGGGSGGRAGSNGIDGIHVNMTNTMNTPIEAIEQYYPVLFEQYELRPETGGKGKWQGGSGLVRAWKLLEPTAEVTVIGDRQKVPPWGLEGGQPGGLGAYWVKRVDGRMEQIKSKATLLLHEGDTLIMETPGGGGYGEEYK
ncbi:MAG: hydantoinase B/oxoprolinase family protein [Chloroflexi bacterium]|nr:hydantoinase B/oxoprolinase family protein [Chloroflexota bacterium]